MPLSLSLTYQGYEVTYTFTARVQGYRFTHLSRGGHWASCLPSQSEWKAMLQVLEAACIRQ